MVSPPPSPRTAHDAAAMARAVGDDAASPPKATRLAYEPHGNTKRKPISQATPPKHAGRTAHHKDPSADRTRRDVAAFRPVSDDGRLPQPLQAISPPDFAPPSASSTAANAKNSTSTKKKKSTIETNRAAINTSDLYTWARPTTFDENNVFVPDDFESYFSKFNIQLRQKFQPRFRS